MALMFLPDISRNSMTMWFGVFGGDLRSDAWRIDSRDEYIPHRPAFLFTILKKVNNDWMDIVLDL